MVKQLPSWTNTTKFSSFWEYPKDNLPLSLSCSSDSQTKKIYYTKSVIWLLDPTVLLQKTVYFFPSIIKDNCSVSTVSSFKGIISFHKRKENGLKVGDYYSYEGILKNLGRNMLNLISSSLFSFSTSQVNNS